MLLADELVSQVEFLKILHRGSSLGYVTVSCGVATTIPDRGTSPDLLLVKADQALYKAKQNGKNRVCPFENEALSLDGINNAC